jgi:hypothetical protein
MPLPALVATVLLLAAASPPLVAAQAPAPAVPQANEQPSTPVIPPPQPPPPVVSDGYVYETAGRRDPFLNLLRTGSDQGVGGSRGDGPAGMTVAEISVRGVMQSRGLLVAAIQGPDNRTYLVRAGDKLMDGVIKALTPEGLIIIQDVNDPLSVVKQREVQKRLPSLEDSKE